MPGELAKQLGELGVGEVAVVDHALRGPRPDEPVSERDRSDPAWLEERLDCRIIGVIAATRAVSTLLPPDTFVGAPALRMEVVGAPDEVPAVQKEFLATCEESEGRTFTMGSLPRERILRAGATGFCGSGHLRAAALGLLPPHERRDLRRLLDR